MYPFNIRVYGLLINEHDQILMSDEERAGFRFSKFPGGGLEFGEGLTDALKREFIEECNVEIEIIEHFYTTDFFSKSVFNESQVISVYYMVRNLKAIDLDFKEKIFNFDGDANCLQSFRWRNMAALQANDVTFPTDQKVVELLKAKWQKEH